jgi:hypothetical protein
VCFTIRIRIKIDIFYSHETYLATCKDFVIEIIEKQFLSISNIFEKIGKERFSKFCDDKVNDLSDIMITKLVRIIFLVL